MKKIFLLISLSLIFITACKKDEPRDEPQPNSNITNIDVTVKYDDWERFNQEYTYGYEAIIAVPEITSDVLHTGAIITYLKDENDFFLVLPITIHTEYYSATYAIGYSEGIFDPAIIFNSYDIETTPQTLDFKIIILKNVPPASLNIKDFDEVKKYYNLSTR